MKTSTNKTQEKTKVQNFVGHKSGCCDARVLATGKKFGKARTLKHRDKQAALTSHSSAN